LTVLHRDFPDPLNLVILLKTNQRTHKRAQVVLFSSHRNLSAEQIVDYSSLRFQLEFNFRDAKQYWGLEDFMNVSPTAVTNTANLACLMVNLSAVLLRPYRQQQPDFRVGDLKTLFRARRYLQETIKWLPHPPDPDLIPALWRKFAALGAIRSRPIDRFAA
jgi:Transposase DDE domain